MSELRPGADTLTLPAQFALRCYDPLTGAVVAGGLRVRLWPAGRPEGVVDATPTRSNFFVAHPLGAPAGPRPWTVEVRDTLGRFLPLQLTAMVPLDTPQLPPVASPPAGLGELLGRDEVPLFSAPTRVMPPGAGLVLADLRTAEGGVAAWAVVTAHAVRRGVVGALLGAGMADRRGSLALPLRLPGSARAGDGATLEQPVVVRLRAFFVGAGPGPPADAPELARALSQPEVTLLGGLSPPAPLADQDVYAGRPLALVTAGATELRISG